MSGVSTNDDKKKIEDEMNKIKADEERYKKLEMEIAVRFILFYRPYFCILGSREE